jgi:integrative and conjugative element protein (TIGR02256 family)
MSCVRPHLIWQNPWLADSKILVEAIPLESVDQYRQNNEVIPEAGGILLGYRREAHLHITMATHPQPSDKRRRYWFSRSPSYHQQVAIRQWQASGMTMDYLGEWHTHPETIPSPSSLDLLEWGKICRKRPSAMVFAIVGWSGDIWLGVSQGNAIAQCQLVEN